MSMTVFVNIQPANTGHAQFIPNKIVTKTILYMNLDPTSENFESFDFKIHFYFDHISEFESF